MELYDAAEVFTKVLWILYGLGGVVCLSIIVGWPTAQWLSERLAYFLSALPDEKYDVPPPRLAMAASLSAHGDLEGALTFYQKLMEDHPQEEEVYHRMLEIVLGPLDRPAQAEQILHRGLTTLEHPRAQAALVREPSSRATRRMAGQGTLLNSVTLSTGPRDAMEMSGTTE